MRSWLLKERSLPWIQQNQTTELCWGHPTKLRAISARLVSEAQDWSANSSLSFHFSPITIFGRADGPPLRKPFDTFEKLCGPIVNHCSGSKVNYGEMDGPLETKGPVIPKYGGPIYGWTDGEAGLLKLIKHGRLVFLCQRVSKMCGLINKTIDLVFLAVKVWWKTGTCTYSKHPKH